jgi:hypothetical protein
MRRLLPLALGFALALACHIDPPGACAATADCESGLTCQGGVCVGCQSDAACGSWQACSATHRCLSRTGYCSADQECDPWAACGASHTCAVKAGQCGDSTDCGSWEQCEAHRCVALAGRCSGQADCAWYLGCTSGHVCGRPTFDGAGVVLWGVLGSSACGPRAVAPVDHPDQARIGFDCAGEGAPAAIGADGNLYYTVDAPPLRGVSRFEPDSATVSGSSGWSFPAAPTANDLTVVASDACAGAGIDHFVMQSGSGAVLYACPALGGGFDYRDTGGTLEYSGDEVLAWTAGGQKLTSGASGYALVSPANVAAPVSGLLPSVQVLAARASGESIWVVDGAGFGAPRRYSVRAPGVATFEGTFAVVPVGTVLVAGSGETAVLDGSGVLWQRGDVGGQGVVVRRPLAPAASTVVYRESDAPAGANAFGSAANPSPFVLLRGGPIVTGR